MNFEYIDQIRQKAGISIDVSEYHGKICACLCLDNLEAETLLPEEINADVIVSNFAQAIYCGSEIIKSHIPIMIVEHCVYPMASCIGRWNNALDNGHSIFLVSKWQEKKYKMMSERTNQRVKRRRFRCHRA